MDRMGKGTAVFSCRNPAAILSGWQSEGRNICYDCHRYPHSDRVLRNVIQRGMRTPPEQGHLHIRAEIGDLYLIYDNKYKQSLKEMRKISRSNCLS